MQMRSPRTLLAISATLALTAAALAPTAAFGKGPGPGAGACDGDCDADQPQAQQIRARDGSGDQQQARGRAGRGSAKQNATQATAGGGGQVRARATSDSSGPDERPRYRASDDDARGQGNAGAGRGWDEDAQRGPEYCDECDAEMGTLTEADIEGLIYMANEEKFAHDVYREFAEMYDLRTFERVAESEARHQLAVRTILERYGLDDQIAALDALDDGEFTVPELQTMYADLIAQGSVDLDGALAAAVTIESADIDDLQQTMAGLDETAPDVFEMYSNLLTASGHHLDAFQRQQ